MAVAVAKCEELAAVAGEVREALADLVAAVGYHPAAAHIGLSVGSLQRWVVRVPVTATLDAAYSNEYCGAVPKLNVGRDRRKLPWYDYLSAFAMMLVGLQLLSLLSGLGILIAAVGALAGGFVALYLAYELGKRLSERFPALKSEHVGFFDR
ncbi:MAG: hypothetical protein OXG50_08275 [bacterium]|nr:hypothetical protein [bacterium]